MMIYQKDIILINVYVLKGITLLTVIMGGDIVLRCFTSYQLLPQVSKIPVF